MRTIVEGTIGLPHARRRRSRLAMWVVAAVMVDPLVVQAQALILSAPITAPRLTDSAQPGTSAIVMPRFGARPWSPSGWGLFATVAGRSADLTSRNGWAEDPNAAPREMEAGLGWRGRTMSATIGYAQPDFGPRIDYLHSPRSQGLVGFNFSLHTR
jgi:hypothetical protein